MHAMILGDPQFHAWAPEILKAIRRDKFVDAATSLYTEIGLSRDEFETIATAAAAAMRLRDDAGKVQNLGRLGVLLLKRLGPDPSYGPDARQFAETLFDQARRHDGSRSWEAPDAAVLMGWVVAHAEHAMAAGLPYSPDGLAETIHAAIRAAGMPFSITDVRDTIRAMTIHRPLADWVLPEEVERLRPVMHEGLIRSLCSPDWAEWLSDAVRVSDGGEWLIEQMQTPQERTLLRERLTELLRQPCAS